MQMKKLILAVMTGLAGVVFADKVDLSKYKWALVGDSLSDPDFNCDCGCKIGKYHHYYHFLAQDTGIQVVYTNCVGGTAYAKPKWNDHDRHYERLLERPIPSDVDIVTIFASHNDNRFAPWHYSGGRVSDTLETTNSLAAYVNKTIDVIQQQAPKAKIVLVSSLCVKGSASEKHAVVVRLLRKIAAYRCVAFYDWLTPNPDDPLDFNKIFTDREFALKYTTDAPIASGVFGHPNELYNKVWLAPHFQQVLTEVLSGKSVPTEPPAVNLSKFKWAVIGDTFSETKKYPWPKYVDIVSAKTGIRIPYENTADTGYWVNHATTNALYQRIRSNPVPADVDVITLFAGWKDFNFDSTKYNQDPDDDVDAGSADDRLPKRTYAAYVNAAIDALVEQAPKAKIIMIGPLYHSGIQLSKLNTVNDVLAKVAAARGIEFHDWLNGQSGDPLDFRQITTDQKFFETYVDDFKYKTLGPNCWYGVPSQAYHEKWIGPQVLGILEKALVR